MHTQADRTTDVFRHEVKYYVNKRDACMLRQYLRHVMHPDIHANQYGEYWIRSLYFDTPDNRDYYEKINGLSERRKLRIRIYHAQTGMAKLEIKNKVGAYVHKEGMQISKADAIRLISGDYGFLLGIPNKVARKFYTCCQVERIRPILLVDYMRQAYDLPFEDIRITIDKNISASMDSHCLFEGNVPLVSVLQNQQYILEVKYHDTLPGFLRSMLSYIHPQTDSISKYVLSRQIMHI